MLNIHEGVKEHHKCEYSTFCNKIFSTKSNLRTHIKLVHEGVKNYICDICEKAFGLASDLRKHVERSHKDPLSI